MAIKAGNFVSWEDRAVEPADIPTFAEIISSAATAGEIKERHMNSIFNKINKSKQTVVEPTPTAKSEINQPSMKDAFYRTSKYLQDLTQK